jgi:predicted TIM-barrel fold metal-dependent hydrolase
MKITRRDFLNSGVAGLTAAALLRPSSLASAAARKAAKFKVGVTDWNLKQTAKTESIALAKKLGFDGVQISIGRQMQMKDPALQQAFLAESKRVGLPLASLCLDILHVNGLKSDPLGRQWVAEAIPIARTMGVKVILLPFFGKWALTTPEEMDYVGDALREIAPAAEKAGVILGLEDTISARDNVRIMERSKSPAVLTYYDVGNSTGAALISSRRSAGLAVRGSARSISRITRASSERERSIFRRLSVRSPTLALINGRISKPTLRQGRSRTI